MNEIYLPKKDSDLVQLEDRTGQPCFVDPAKVHRVAAAGISGYSVIDMLIGNTAMGFLVVGDPEDVYAKLRGVQVDG